MLGVWLNAEEEDEGFVELNMKFWGGICGLGLGDGAKPVGVVDTSSSRKCLVLLFGVVERKWCDGCCGAGGAGEGEGEYEGEAARAPVIAHNNDSTISLRVAMKEKMTKY
jgi:hypothetical protein